MRLTISMTAALGCAAVLLVAGCTSEQVESATSTTAVASPVASPTPTPTPTVPGPIDRSDAALGIGFEDLPDVTGDARAALDVYTYFEVEVWRSTVDGKVSDAVRAVANPDVLQAIQNQVDGNADVTVSGTTLIRIRDVEADAASATVTSCNDSTGAIFTLAGGDTETGSEAGVEPSTIVTVLVKEPDMPWQVTEAYATGAPC